MDILYLTNEEFYNLDFFKLRKGTIHCESDFYIAPNKKDILKYYLDNNKNYLERKKYTVKYLNDFNVEKQINGLIIPKGIFYVDNTFKGIILPKTPGINASVYLNSSKCPLNIKIEILKQIGKILEDIKVIGNNYNMAYGDVHADNFLVDGIYKEYLDDISNIKVYGIDTDSAKILDSDGYINYILFNNPWIKDYNKYESDVFGNILPNYNTDLFCFIMMILGVIFDEKIYELELDEFKNYIDYLDILGFDSKLLECISSIYTDNDTINPIYYLDRLNNMGRYLESGKKLSLNR